MKDVVIFQGFLQKINNSVLFLYIKLIRLIKLINYIPQIA